MSDHEELAREELAADVIRIIDSQPHRVDSLREILWSVCDDPLSDPYSAVMNASPSTLGLIDEFVTNSNRTTDAIEKKRVEKSPHDLKSQQRRLQLRFDQIKQGIRDYHDLHRRRPKVGEVMRSIKGIRGNDKERRWRDLKSVFNIERWEPFADDVIAEHEAEKPL